MIVIDPADFELPLTPARIRLICDRHLGVGADGICYGPLPQPESPLTMRFFNPDGTEAEKSGNGLRIFARYIWDRGYDVRAEFPIAIGDEVAPVTVLDEEAQELTIGMGRLSFGFVEEEMQFGAWVGRATAVAIGNPHCVIFTDDVAAIRQLGPLIENAPTFPNRTNVQLGRIVDEHTMEIEIWERGAGYTLASGSSASAVAGAAIKTGRCSSPVRVRMPGGAVLVEVDADWRVMLTGAVAAVYKGIFAPVFAVELSSLDRLKPDIGAGNGLSGG
jgi:diaminopimelate epimerase